MIKKMKIGWLTSNICVTQATSQRRYVYLGPQLSCLRSNNARCIGCDLQPVSERRIFGDLESLSSSAFVFYNITESLLPSHSISSDAFFRACQKLVGTVEDLALWVFVICDVESVDDFCNS